MHHVVDISALGLSILSLVGLVILGALASALASTGYRLLQFTWWLRDVDGPPSHSFPFGHYADFFAKDIVETCLGWMDQYGSAVRHMSFFGEPRLLLADPVALDHILLRHPYAYSKQPDFSRFLTMIMGPGLLASEGDQHRRQKRAIQQGFAPLSVRAYYPIFLLHARHFRHRLLDTIEHSRLGKESASEKVLSQRDGAEKAEASSRTTDFASHTVAIDILKPSARVSVDILAHTGFGQSFNALASDDVFGALRTSHTDPPLPPSSQSLMHAFDSLIETAGSTASKTSRLLYDVATMFVPWLVDLPFTIAHNPRVRLARKAMDAEAARLLADAERAERERVELLYAEKNSSSSTQKAADGAKDNKGRQYHAGDEPIEQSPQRPASIVSFMMRARDMARRSSRKASLQLTQEDLFGQVTTLLLAGHETTSTQLAWMLGGLAKHPEQQETLRKTIRDKRLELGLAPMSRGWTSAETVIVPEDDTGHDAERELTLDEMESIMYLDWAVQEMLRLYSPIHTSSRTATRDDVLPIDPESSPYAPKEGIPIHRGVTIIIPIEAINRDPRLWGNDAHAYRPERWRDASLPGVQRFRTQKGGAAFLFGPRGCIGARFSVAELKTILAVVLPSLQFHDAQRTVVRNRWIVARPWDTQAGRDQAPVLIGRAQVSSSNGIYSH